MIDFCFNSFYQTLPQWLPVDRVELSDSRVQIVHRSLPEYRPTPLVRLPGLAGELGVGKILVKDESHRFGLKAFKALGATYAIFRFLLEELGDDNVSPADFYRSKELPPGQYAFCTATDGNHGRGVAWAAAKLNQMAVIFMPRGSVRARVEAIRTEGAEVHVVDGDYDEAVRQAIAAAAENGWHVISDTSWDGYEQIPRWITAGYFTLFAEIDEALNPGEEIDLAIVPAGVGALAAAAAWHFRGLRGPGKVKLVSVEPLEAACMLESIRTPDGHAVVCRGRLDSIMAGLNCGTPSRIAWPVIRDNYDLFLAVDDDYCRRAVRAYYNAERGDPRIIAGESGAASLAGLLAMLDRGAPGELRRQLGLDSHSTVLLLNTEGPTDPDGFQRILQSGRF